MGAGWIILAIVVFLAIIGLGVFFGWLAIKTGVETFKVTEDSPAPGKGWARWAAVLTGIVFMNAAIVSIPSAFTSSGAILALGSSYKEFKSY